MGSMFDSISRIFDSNRGKNTNQSPRHPQTHNNYVRDFDDDNVDVEKTKARVIKELGRENAELLAQVAELKQQVAVLHDLMDAKEVQAKELEIAMERKDVENMNDINNRIENNNKQIEQTAKQLTGQLNTLSERVDAHFNQLEIKIDAQNNQGGRDSEEQMEKLAATIEEKMNGVVEGIDEKLNAATEKLEAAALVSDRGNDEIINTISENVHNESVKCYRNIQTILEEIEDKLTVIENKKTSITGTTACVVITMLLCMGNLALIVLMILGIV